jgi:hypothetical protein
MEPALSTSSTPPAAHEPGLHWGVKHRFLQYIARMPDGQCSTTDGATLDDTNRFHFTLDRTDLTQAAAVGVVTCRGDVRFAGHHGMLFVAITYPVVHLQGDRGRLTIATAPGTKDAAGDRLVLADFDTDALPAAGSARFIRATSVRLSSDAVNIFNSVYPAGEPLDDFTLVVPDPDHPRTQETW